MKQTAVEWLIEQFEGDDSKIARVIGLKEYNIITKKAKKIEKEQKIDDIVQFGIEYHHKYSEEEIKRLCENAEEYYNETYKNKTK